MHAKNSHQNKQGGHHYLGDALYALLHACRADRETDQRYQQHPSRHFNWVADHGRKNSRDIVRSVKGSYAGFEQVGNHPTTHAGVKHHQHVVAYKGKPLEPMPLGAARLQGIKASRCRAMACATYGKFHHQQRHAQHHQEE